MTSYPRFAERLRAALVTHGRRERSDRPAHPATGEFHGEFPGEVPGDKGQQFAQRLREALPPQRRRPPVTTFTEL